MGTRYPGTPEEKAALDAFIKLCRAYESVTDVAQKEIPNDLTATQFGVLEALYYAGPLCLGALAAKVLKSAGNLTLVVFNLEKAGLVQRLRSEGDRRFVTVELTPQGRTLISQASPVVLKKIWERMSVLTTEEQLQFGALCKKLGKIQEPDPQDHK